MMTKESTVAECPMCKVLDDRVRELERRLERLRPLEVRDVPVWFWLIWIGVPLLLACWGANHG